MKHGRTTSQKPDAAAADDRDPRTGRFVQGNAAGVAHRFRPGRSGNPRGRPPKDRRRADAQTQAESAPKPQPPDSVPIPASLDTPRFRSAWRAWLEHRRETGRPVTAEVAERALAILAAVGVERALARIHDAFEKWYAQTVRQRTGILGRSAGSRSVGT